jgi:carbonic anhydrase
MKINSILISVCIGTLSMQCSSNTTPSIQAEMDPFVRLKNGNERFYQEKSVHPNISHKRILEVSKEQHPFAIIISCSDSRAPDEIVFDQGLGDLFVIRTAGNVIADIGLGSIEYAIEHLNVKCILIMGHEQCGAVKAFATHLHPDNHVSTILDTLMNEVEIQKLETMNNRADYVSKLVRANVAHQVRKIIHSSIQMEQKVRNKELKIQGAIYDIENGRVSFMKDDYDLK